MLTSSAALIDRVVTEKTHPAAVILATKAEARFAPLADATVHFQLGEGTKVSILEDRGQWVLVERNDEQQGWVKAGAVERVVTARAGDGMRQCFYYMIVMRVLIAEDTESVRFALRLAMEYLGHEVVGTACDGEEALEQYQLTHPEIVLMDVRMPLLDGLLCTTILSKQDPHAKVVIVTGGRTTERDALHAGARALLEKPFELDRLGDLIHQVGEAA